LFKTPVTLMHIAIRKGLGVFRHLYITSTALLLAGCLGAEVQPQTGLDSTSAVAQSSSAPESTNDAPSVSVEQVVVERDSPSLSNQIDQLMGRLTLVQEQVINQRALLQQQLELTQVILQRMQLLTNTALIDETKTPNSSVNTDLRSDQLDAALNQLLQVANEMQLNASQSAGVELWEVTSAVTSKGWILIRYRQDTGESWITENASWTLLKDESTPAIGDYSVQIERRDVDSKGYVAVRLNRKTGNTWWLNDRTWQAY